MGKANKNRTGQADTKRSHLCPECKEPAKLAMRMPGKSMWGSCENGHSHPKKALILK